MCVDDNAAQILRAIKIRCLTRRHLLIDWPEWPVNSGPEHQSASPFQNAVPLSRTQPIQESVRIITDINRKLAIQTKKYRFYLKLHIFSKTMLCATFMNAGVHSHPLYMVSDSRAVAATPTASAKNAVLPGGAH